MKNSAIASCTLHSSSPTTDRGSGAGGRVTSNCATCRPLLGLPHKGTPRPQPRGGTPCSRAPGAGRSPWPLLKATSARTEKRRAVERTGPVSLRPPGSALGDLPKPHLLLPTPLSHGHDRGPLTGTRARRKHGLHHGPRESGRLEAECAGEQLMSRSVTRVPDPLSVLRGPCSPRPASLRHPAPRLVEKQALPSRRGRPGRARRFLLFHCPQDTLKSVLHKDLRRGHAPRAHSFLLSLRDVTSPNRVASQLSRVQEAQQGEASVTRCYVCNRSTWTPHRCPYHTRGLENGPRCCLNHHDGCDCDPLRRRETTYVLGQPYLPPVTLQNTSFLFKTVQFLY